MPPLVVEIWSDIACPWCYVGKRRFEAARASFAHGAAIEVQWRAFELDPTAPRVKAPGPSYAERLAGKYRVALPQAEGMIRTMTATAAAEGLDFRFDRIRPGNTFDAHRVLHFAAARGRGEEAKERLLLAYMTEGESIGEREVLARLAGEVGLDAAEVRTMLASEAHVQSVRADEDEAHERGIHSVPHFLIGGRIAISGAQPAEVLGRALQDAWAELPRVPPADGFAHGGACGFDGCVPGP